MHSYWGISLQLFRFQCTVVEVSVHIVEVSVHSCWGFSAQLLRFQCTLVDVSAHSC